MGSLVVHSEGAWLRDASFIYNIEHWPARSQKGMAISEQLSKSDEALSWANFNCETQPGVGTEFTVVPVLDNLQSSENYSSLESNISFDTESGLSSTKLNRPNGSKRETSARDETVRNAPTFKSLEQWVGYVTSIDKAKNTFTATLQSNGHDKGEEVGEFSFEETSPDDHELITEGAIFYWSVGYVTSSSRQRSTHSTLRFRRVFLWKKSVLDGAQARAEELAAWISQS